MSRTRCVVFDIDDTLYLERDYVRSGFEAVGRWAASEVGARDFSARAWRLFEQGARRNTFTLVLDELGIDATPELVEQLVKIYREHQPSISLLPDATECLRSLHGRMRLAAITDGPRSSQRAKADALGLGRWLSPIILTDELGPGLGKPHVHAFGLVQEATGTRGDACVYVADNPAKDFIAPRQLGWMTIRIRRPLSLHFNSEHGDDVDYVLPDLYDLPRLLGVS